MAMIQKPTLPPKKIRISNMKDNSDDSSMLQKTKNNSKNEINNNNDNLIFSQILEKMQNKQKKSQ